MYKISARPSFKFLRNIKIQYRLLVVFFVISLVPSICLGTYAYRVYTNSINRKLGDSTLQAVLSLNKNMVTELEKFQDYISTVSVSKIIQTELPRISNDGEVPTREFVVGINNMSKEVPFHSKYLKNLRVADINGNVVYDLGYDNVSAEQFDAILKNIDEASPLDSMQYIHTYRAMNKLILGRKIYNVNALIDPIGYVMVYIDEKLISEQIFSDVSFGEGSIIMLVSSDGIVMSAQNKKRLGSSLSPASLFAEVQQNLEQGKHSFNTEVNGVKSLVIAAYNQDFGNYLIATIPSSYITNETRSINRMLFFLGALLIVLSLICTFFVYISIIRPIRHMVTVCEKNSSDNKSRHIGDSAADELGFLANTIDHMVDEQQIFMEKRKEDQIRQRELELEMLRYQINPHFLFNTLNSLRWIAVVNDIPVLDEGISSLSALLRSTLTKKNEFISLREEIENLKHYFSIQRIRYGNSFDVVYELEETSLDYKLPRFVLQPLAENSIIHGSDGATTILITVFSCINEEKHLIIEIRDNGKGFDTNKQPDASKDHFSGIGVNNVAERLSLHYKTPHCLTITSKPGHGTVCRLAIPVLEK